MTPAENNKQTKRQRTWYGLTATVVMGPGFRHEAGFGRLLIPHPPVANWLLRRGLRQADKRALSFAHEIGHFQTAPLALLCLGANVLAANGTGRLNLAVGLFLLIGNHSAWEVLAEMSVVAGHRSFYHQCYEGVSKLPRLLFWASATALSLAGWLAAIGTA